MIVVNLKGGLGNQMFQYAFGLALAQKYGASVKFDLRTLRDRTPRSGSVARDYDLDVFSILPIQATPDDLFGVGLGFPDVRFQRVLSRLYGCVPGQSRILQERDISFDPRRLSIGGNAYIDGYWQSEKYFKDIEPLVRERFVVTAPISSEAAALGEQISRQESVCVNVRRGDFVNHPLHPACDREYFERAVAELTRRIGDAFPVFIFSDDVDWCRENLRLAKNQHIVGHEFAGLKFATYFYLMSACKHFIIPNSSFAWWAAWIAKNESKVVIGPSRWFADPTMDTSSVLPENWVHV